MLRRCLVAAVLLAALAIPVSAQSVRAGIEAWQRGDYSGAVATWRPLAEKGDADASFNLGQAYRLGRGVPTNLSAAKSWFERAANKRHVDAQTTLGLLLFQNGEQAGGLKWLKEAADQGEPRALLVYGTALFNGDGVTQDPVRGYAYVSRAAAQGLAPAKETLAQLDSLMPVADRKRGVAIAREQARAAPPPSSRLVRPAKPARPPAPEKVASAPGPSTVAKSAARGATRPAEAVAGADGATAVGAAGAAAGPWRIQLGAFSQRGSAEALYRKLARDSALAGRRPFYIPVGTITRLQVGPFATKSAAASACKALAVPCFAVPAK